VANRNRLEVEGVVGFFVNTVLLRVSLAGDPTFSELLAQVREVALTAYAHQDLPLEKVVEELPCQVVFVSRNTTRHRLDLAALDASVVEVETGTAKFDWTLAHQERGEGLCLRLEYAVDRFDEASIRRVLGHYSTLLESAVTAAEARL